MGGAAGRRASRAPLLSLSHTIEMCFLSFAVSGGIERGGVCPTADGAASLATFASEVRRRCVIAASTHSSQPCNVDDFCCLGREQTDGTNHALVWIPRCELLCVVLTPVLFRPRTRTYMGMDGSGSYVVTGAQNVACRYLLKIF